MSDWMLLVVSAALGAYGVWAVSRDIKRGRASARGFGFDKTTQPKRYLALTAFNCFAVALIVVGFIVTAAKLLWHVIAH